MLMYLKQPHKEEGGCLHLKCANDNLFLEWCEKTSVNEYNLLENIVLSDIMLFSFAVSKVHHIT